MEHATWIKATAHLHVLAKMLICLLLARSRTSRPQHATNARTIYTFLKLYKRFFYVLPAWKHDFMFVGALHFLRTLP
jgi:hypothetical protein